MPLRKGFPRPNGRGILYYKKEVNYFSIPFSVPSAQARASAILEAS